MQTVCSQHVAYMCVCACVCKPPLCQGAVDAIVQVRGKNTKKVIGHIALAVENNPWYAKQLEEFTSSIGHYMETVPKLKELIKQLGESEPAPTDHSVLTEAMSRLVHAQAVLRPGVADELERDLLPMVMSHWEKLSATQQTKEVWLAAQPFFHECSLAFPTDAKVQQIPLQLGELMASSDVTSRSAGLKKALTDVIGACSSADEGAPMDMPKIQAVLDACALVEGDLASKKVTECKADASKVIDLMLKSVGTEKGLMQEEHEVIMDAAAALLTVAPREEASLLVAGLCAAQAMQSRLADIA